MFRVCSLRKTVTFECFWFVFCLLTQSGFPLQVPNPRAGGSRVISWGMDMKIKLKKAANIGAGFMPRVEKQGKKRTQSKEIY